MAIYRESLRPPQGGLVFLKLSNTLGSVIESGGIFVRWLNGAVVTQGLELG